MHKPVKLLEGRYSPGERGKKAAPGEMQARRSGKGAAGRSTKNRKKRGRDTNNVDPRPLIKRWVEGRDAGVEGVRDTTDSENGPGGNEAAQE